MLKKLFFAKNRPHFSLFSSRIQLLFFMFFAVKPRLSLGLTLFLYAHNSRILAHPVPCFKILKLW